MYLRIVSGFASQILHTKYQSLRNVCSTQNSLRRYSQYSFRILNVDNHFNLLMIWDIVSRDLNASKNILQQWLNKYYGWWDISQKQDELPTVVGAMTLEA